MSSSGRLVYDPISVFVTVFSDPGLIRDIAFALDCPEVNVLTGLLESHGRSDAAALWQAYHLGDCDDPRRH
ncbi:hypothetical protein AB0A74_26550 [Saccharothrix sp. NPDC042600]|uniref:hypothetical protein n=1 Tax=Saccharothrix TaxID=2071 RepID=UPI0033C3A1D0|nr:hypothetical protein GCM10017745_46500 [Saccharothrix mutabilis subsp. capreolus]